MRWLGNGCYWKENQSHGDEEGEARQTIQIGCERSTARTAQRIHVLGKLHFGKWQEHHESKKKSGDGKECVLEVKRISKKTS